MRFAIYNGGKTNARDVESGALGKDLWYKSYDVVACVGKYRQYWKYMGVKPELPPGYENESEWHARWKSLVDDEHVEVVFGEHNEHRADIFTGDEIIEIQRSPIDIRDAKERTEFYRTLFPEARVIWIINIVDAWKNIVIDKTKGTFTWKYERKWVMDLTGKDTVIFLDYRETGKYLLKVWKYDGNYFYKYVEKLNFYKEYLEKVAAKEYTDDPKKVITDLISMDT